MRRGTAVTTTAFKYRVLNIYTKSYYKWFITGEKQHWSPDIREKGKKEIQTSS